MKAEREPVGGGEKMPVAGAVLDPLVAARVRKAEADVSVLQRLRPCLCAAAPAAAQ